MSELSQFVRKRAIDNVLTGVVVAAHAGNPSLFEVRIPDGKQLTLATAGERDLVAEFRSKLLSQAATASELISPTRRPSFSSAMHSTAS